MSLKSEFSSQWQTFLNIIEAEMCQSIAKNGKIELDIANKIIQAEANKWFDGSHFNSIWLRNLVKNQPQVGQEIEAHLKNLQLRTRITYQSESPILSLSVAVVLGLFAFFTLGLQEIFILQRLVGSIAITALVASLFGGLRTSRKKKGLSSALQQVRKELNVTGVKLKEILQKCE